MKFSLKSFNLLLLVFILVSCSHQSGIDDESSIKIRVNTDNKVKILLSEVCSQVEYLGIYNETVKLPVSRVSKLIFINDRFFLFDQNQGSVFIFSEDGEFLNSFLILKGRGPFEMEMVADMAVDYDNKSIIILGFAKVVVYKFNGEPVDEVQMTILPKKVGVSQGDYLFLLNSNSPERQVDGGYNLIVMSDDGTVKEKFLKSSYIENQKKFFFLVSNNFPRYNGSQLFFNSPDNNIYEIKIRSLNVKYTVDFGSNSIPEGFFESINPGTPINEILQNIFSQGYVTLLHNVLETDHHLYFQFHTSYEDKATVVFYSKNSRNIKSGKAVVNDLDKTIQNNIYFRYSYQNYIVKTIFTENLTDIEKKKVLELLRNNSNHLSDPEIILMLCKTKEF